MTAHLITINELTPQNDAAVTYVFFVLHTLGDV